MLNKKKIKLENLNKYGFTDAILKSMVEYDVMFPIEKRTDAKNKVTLFVWESDVVLFLNRMLENTMSLYKMVDETEKAKENAKNILESAPTLSELAKLESGNN